MDADATFFAFLIILLLATLVLPVLLVTGLALIVIYAVFVIVCDLVRIVIAVREAKRRADDSNANP